MFIQSLHNTYLSEFNALLITKFDFIYLGIFHIGIYEAKNVGYFFYCPFRVSNKFSSRLSAKIFLHV